MLPCGHKLCMKCARSTSPNAFTGTLYFYLFQFYLFIIIILGREDKFQDQFGSINIAGMPTKITLEIKNEHYFPLLIHLTQIKSDTNDYNINAKIKLPSYSFFTLVSTLAHVQHTFTSTHSLAHYHHHNENKENNINEIFPIILERREYGITCPYRCSNTSRAEVRRSSYDYLVIFFLFYFHFLSFQYI